MSILIWLAASSLLWGGVLWGAGRLLQRSPNVSGRMRQWIWRGATALLVAPWIAAPLVIAFGLGLAPSETVAVQTLAPLTGGDELAAMHAMDMANVETAVIANGGTIWAALGSLNFAEILLLVVIAGWLVRFVAAQLALRNLLGIVMLSRKKTAGAAHESIGRWSQRLMMRKSPQLRVVQDQHSPFSYGAIRPTVCLPEGLEEKLSRQSLDLVVGHECVHVARGDGWLRPVERVTADVFWFNPFAWLIRRELDTARELAVDETVIEMAESRVMYARTLRDVAGFTAGLSATSPAASMSLAGGRNLMLRVSRTLSQAKRRPARAAIIAACVLGAVGAPLAVAQVMLAVPAPPEPPRLVAPVAPEAPEPPAAVFDTDDGVISASFRATVTATSGSRDDGFSVELLQTGANEQGEVCLAKLDGLGSISVSRNDVVARGGEVGRASKTGRMSFWVTCSDELDAQGRPKAEPPPAPPEPPEALAPLGPMEALEAPEAPEALEELEALDEVAPVAPAAPAAPATPVNGVAPPAPPAPVAAPAPRPAVTPTTPATPRVAPTPLVQPTPLTPRTPAVAPTPPTPPTWSGQQPMSAPQAPAAPPAVPGYRTTLTLDGASNPIVETAYRTMPFGEIRDAFTGKTIYHSGVDLAAFKGARVHAPGSGKVTLTDENGAHGKTVQVVMSNGFVMRFAQLDEISVSVGDSVTAGTVIGSMGSSGSASTGPHLHFEVEVNGHVVNPEAVTGLQLAAQLKMPGQKKQQ